MSFQTKDTMILSRYNDSIVERYARKTYTIDNTPLFDQIILYYPHTKFSDSKIFSIQRDGTFFSKKYFEQSWFVAETDKSVFEQIEVLFKKSDLMNMESLNSRTSVTNQLRINDVIMTIVCGNKMYTIDRVFQQIHFNNIEFYWAFFSALYTPETVNIMPKESVNEENTAPFVLKDYIRYKLVRNDSVEIRLHLTEHFYLTTLLYNAPLTEQTFIPMYKLFAGSDFKTTIETDGRFFKYDIEHYESKTVKKSITLDIGFNFIEENHLDK